MFDAVVLAVMHHLVVMMVDDLVMMMMDVMLVHRCGIGGDGREGQGGGEAERGQEILGHGIISFD